MRDTAYADSYAAMYGPPRPWYGRTVFKKLVVAGVAALTGAAVLMTSLAGATNLTIGGPSDCDDNAVIHCGAHSVGAVVNDYDQSAYVRAVYASFGISNGDIHALASTAVEGRVTKQGDVYAGGQLVARNAVTGGRQDIPGSTKVNADGAIFFRRPPSVSFVSDSLPAYVSMQNGRFQFAVIASCGNPVAAAPVVQKTAVAPAQPVSKPKPPHQPPVKPPAQTQTPPPQTPPQNQTQTQTQQVNQNQQVNQTQTQQVTVENQNVVTPPAASTPPPASTPPATPPATTSTTPASTEAVATTAAPASEQPAQTVASAPVSTLPNTGPGDIIGIFTATSLIGFLGFRLFLLRKLG